MHRKKGPSSYNLTNGSGSSPSQPVTTYHRQESKEDLALIQFKARIKDVLTDPYDDHALKKWLKARQYDVNKAEQMFRASMKYREAMNIDELVRTYKPPEVLQKYLTGGLCGYDKEGSPILVERLGQQDLKGIMYSCRKLDLEKTKILQFEKTVRAWEEQSKRLRRRVDGQTVIIDMNGINSQMLWRPGRQMQLYLVKVLEDNYPEMLKRLIVVNAPSIFPMLYKFTRPLLSEAMRNKIHVVGSDFRHTLLTYIDASQLPVALGGTMTGKDGDPYCSDKICPGGIVPKSYYLQGSDIQSMETATVPRGDKLTLKYNVEKPGSIIRWEFKTEDFDIGFGVFFVKNDKREPIVEYERVNSHIVPEDGNHTCQEAGTYELLFDNTFSWARGKKIYYSVETVIPDTSLQDELDQMVPGEGGWGNLVISETTELTKL